jgi:uncharacterized caspase-like protein
MAKIALLIGVSEYEPGLNPLPSAVKDVEAMQQVLLRPDIGEFVESDITVLKNPERQKMEEEIEKLFVNRQKDDLVLLFSPVMVLKMILASFIWQRATLAKLPEES